MLISKRDYRSAQRLRFSILISIFKFLKWTKGEVKTLDFILGISAAKSKALEKNAKQEVKWLKQSAARKKVNGIGKFLKQNPVSKT